MTTIAVTMVKNEQDIVGPIVEHMISQVDHVIVADNLSTDNTRPWRWRTLLKSLRTLLLQEQFQKYILE